MIDDGRFIFSYYLYKKSFRFLNHCRKISVPSLSIIFEGLALSSGPLRKQKFTSIGSKGHGLWFAIGGFGFVLCVFVAFELACEQALRGALAAGREKEGELATRSLEFEYLHRKSRCEMLIGGDDISNDVITLKRVFRCLFTFELVSPSRWFAEIWQLSRRRATGKLELEF